MIHAFDVELHLFFVTQPRGVFCSSLELRIATVGDTARDAAAAFVEVARRWANGVRAAGDVHAGITFAEPGPSDLDEWRGWAATEPDSVAVGRVRGATVEA